MNRTDSNVFRTISFAVRALFVVSLCVHAIIFHITPASSQHSMRHRPRDKAAPSPKCSTPMSTSQHIHKSKSRFFSVMKRSTHYSHLAVLFECVHGCFSFLIQSLLHHDTNAPGSISNEPRANRKRCAGRRSASQGQSGKASRSKGNCLCRHRRYQQCLPIQHLRISDFFSFFL